MNTAPLQPARRPAVDHADEAAATAKEDVPFDMDPDIPDEPLETHHEDDVCCIGEGYTTSQRRTITQNVVKGGGRVVPGITKQVNTIFVKKQPGNSILMIPQVPRGPKTSLARADLFQHYGINHDTGLGPDAALRRPKLVDSDYSMIQRAGKDYTASFRWCTKSVLATNPPAAGPPVGEGVLGRGNDGSRDEGDDISEDESEIEWENVRILSKPDIASNAGAGPSTRIAQASEVTTGQSSLTGRPIATSFQTDMLDIPVGAAGFYKLPDGTTGSLWEFAKRSGEAAAAAQAGGIRPGPLVNRPLPPKPEYTMTGGFGSAPSHHGTAPRHLLPGTYGPVGIHNGLAIGHNQRLTTDMNASHGASRPGTSIRADHRLQYGMGVFPVGNAQQRAQYAASHSGSSGHLSSVNNGAAGPSTPSGATRPVKREMDERGEGHGEVGVRKRPLNEAVGTGEEHGVDDNGPAKAKKVIIDLTLEDD